MGTSDAVLPWALKILMIALVTVAVFIYRKPFVHLFSAVGYGMVGSRDRADAGLAQAAASPGGTRWTPPPWESPALPRTGRPGGPGGTRRRRPAWPPPPAGGAGAAAAGASAASAATVGSENGGPEQAGAPGDVSTDEAQGGSGRSGAASRGRGRAAAAAAADGSPRAAPPLDLPDRDGSGQQRSPSGWARSGAADAAAGRAPADAGPAAEAPGARGSGGSAPDPVLPDPVLRGPRRPRVPARPGGVRRGSPGSGPAALAGRRAAPARGGPPAVWRQHRAGHGRGTAHVRSRSIPQWCAVPEQWPGPQPACRPGVATRGAARRAVTARAVRASGAARRAAGAQAARARPVGRPGMRRHRCGPGTAARVAVPATARPAGEVVRVSLPRRPPRPVSSAADKPEAASPDRARSPVRPVPSGCARCAGRSSGASWT